MGTLLWILVGIAVWAVLVIGTLVFFAGAQMLSRDKRSIGRLRGDGS